MRNTNEWKERMATTASKMLIKEADTSVKECILWLLYEPEMPLEMIQEDEE